MEGDDEIMAKKSRHSHWDFCTYEGQRTTISLNQNMSMKA